MKQLKLGRLMLTWNGCYAKFHICIAVVKYQAWLDVFFGTTTGKLAEVCYADVRRLR